jgi:hypothetical protein
MKFFLACLVWLAIGVILGLGILMLSKGNAWLFVVSMLGFVLAVAKIGCSQGT